MRSRTRSRSTSHSVSEARVIQSPAGITAEVDVHVEESQSNSLSGSGGEQSVRQPAVTLDTVKQTPNRGPEDSLEMETGFMPTQLAVIEKMVEAQVQALQREHWSRSPQHGGRWASCSEDSNSQDRASERRSTDRSHSRSRSQGRRGGAQVGVAGMISDPLQGHDIANASATASVPQSQVFADFEATFEKIKTQWKNDPVSAQASVSATSALTEIMNNYLTNRQVSPTCAVSSMRFNVSSEGEELSLLGRRLGREGSEETHPPVSPWPSGLASALRNQGVPDVGPPSGQSSSFLSEVEKLMAIFNMESESTLYSHLDQKVIDKIVAFEYVDFATLFKGKFRPKTKEGASTYKLVKNDKGNMVYEPVKDDHQREISDFGVWSQAWHIYCAVLAKYHPSKSYQLHQYYNTIELAAKSYTWESVYEYDQQFRSLIESKPERTWALKQTEWYMDMITKSLESKITGGKQTHKSVQDQPAEKSGSTPGKKKEVCLKYQQGSCTYGKKCNWDHRCIICTKPGHGAIQCFKRNTEEGSRHPPVTQGARPKGPTGSGAKQADK